MNLSFMNRASFTGRLVATQTVPANRDAGIVTAIVSAPVDPANVFDVTMIVEVLENGDWIVRDNNIGRRDLVSGPTEAITYAWSAGMERLAGKDIRVTFDCGQSTVSVSVAITV